MPADFASKEAEELDGVEFYEQLKKVRDSNAYPPAVHYQRDDSEASEALRKARFVLVHQDRHKPPLAEAYRGPYKIKSRSDNRYLLKGGNDTEDQVAINRLKPFHVGEGEEEIDLQTLPRRGRPARVARPASPSIHYFFQESSSLADVAWRPKHRFFSSNVVQRPQHHFLAKLWHKNDAFDEKKRCVGVLNDAKHCPEAARLTSPREF